MMVLLTVYYKLYINLNYNIIIKYIFSRHSNVTCCCSLEVDPPTAALCPTSSTDPAPPPTRQAGTTEQVTTPKSKDRLSFCREEVGAGGAAEWLPSGGAVGSKDDLANLYVAVLREVVAHICILHLNSCLHLQHVVCHLLLVQVHFDLSHHLPIFCGIF